MNTVGELLRVQNIDAEYIAQPGDPPVYVVDDVSLNLRRGEVLGIAACVNASSPRSRRS
jgi:ABC-type glutathione transport system ATPase component